jgi:hypothetical protein
MEIAKYDLTPVGYLVAGVFVMCIPLYVIAAY